MEGRAKCHFSVRMRCKQGCTVISNVTEIINQAHNRKCIWKDSKRGYQNLESLQ